MCAARTSQSRWIKAVEADFSWTRNADLAIGGGLFEGVETLKSWVSQFQTDDMRSRKAVKTICPHPKANRIEDLVLNLPNATSVDIY